MEMEFDPGEGDDSEYVEVDPTGRYGRYNEELGRGAQKIVYKAFDMVDGIEVAWNKLRIKNDIYYKEEHCSEVELLKSLKHKNIIKYYTSWAVKGSSYVDLNIITEIFTSGTLKEYRQKHKNAGIKAVKSWARQILRGLVHLHSHAPPIIHRDLKCDNIFVNGNHGEVKIGDLGLAVMQTANRGCSTRGTFEFMAPEMFEGNYNESVDIYSFGMCLIELVTLDYPYCECKSLGALYKRISEGVKPASLNKVKNLEVRDFIENCITNEASERPTAEELLNHPWISTDAEDMDIDESVEGEKDSNYLTGTPPILKDEEWLGDNRERVKQDTIKQDTGSEQFEWKKDFKLKGKQCGGQLSLYMRITYNGATRTIQFPFDMAVDTALGVASEMSVELGLLQEDVPKIAEMIQAEIEASMELEDELARCTDGKTVMEEASSSDFAAGKVEKPPAIQPQVAVTEEEAATFGRFEEVSARALSESEEHDMSSCLTCDLPLRPRALFDRQDMVVTWVGHDSPGAEPPDILEAEGLDVNRTGELLIGGGEELGGDNMIMDAERASENGFMTFRDFVPAGDAGSGSGISEGSPTSYEGREHYDTGQVSYGFYGGCGTVLPKDLNGLAKNGVCVTTGGNNIGRNRAGIGTGVFL